MSAVTVLRCSNSQAATGAQLATDSVPRRSARLQVWCASNRAELELGRGRQRASSLAPLLPSAVHVSAHGSSKTKAWQSHLSQQLHPDAL